MDSRLSGFILFAIICVSYMKAEGSDSLCESISPNFRSFCFSEDKCSITCKKGGFLYGKCKGFRRHCMCYKDCSRGGASEYGGAGGSGSSGDYSNGGASDYGGAGSYSNGGVGGMSSFNSYSDGSTASHA